MKILTMIQSALSAAYLNFSVWTVWLLPDRRVEASNVRLADELNHRWIKRYREMAARLA